MALTVDKNKQENAPSMVRLYFEKTDLMGETGGINHVEIFNVRKLVEAYPAATLSELIGDPGATRNMPVPDDRLDELAQFLDMAPGRPKNTRIRISRQDLAAMVLETDRLDELPAQREWILELAPKDIADRYQANKAQERMLEHEPTLAKGRGNTPSP